MLNNKQKTLKIEKSLCYTNFLQERNI